MSKERDAVNGSNFKRRCAAVVRSGKSIRGNIQELYHYAVVSYLDPANNGNTNDLTYLFTQVAGVKSLNHKLLGQCIEDTINVKLAKTSEGGFVFRKAERGVAPSLLDDADLSAPWWEHGRTPEIKEYDIIKSLEAMVKALEASVSGDEKKRPICPAQAGIVAEVTQRVNELKSWTERTIAVRAAAANAEAGTVITSLVGPVQQAA